MSVLEPCLVIGGCGFLGRHIVEALVARGIPVAVFDLVQRHFDTNIQFFTGDISDEVALANAIRKSGAKAIYHTASPPALLPQHVYHKANVEGTKTVISAATAHGVKYLIYTSSAGILFDGADLIDADERLPPPVTPMDAYNGTKAIAEQLILEANGKDGLKTVALRPSGIFGPGDRQGIVTAADAVKRGQTKVQIGSNENLTDWTYVGNVVKAHLLAHEKLANPDTRTREEILSKPLPSVALSTGERRIPTSAARPVGPAMIRPDNADELEAAFTRPRELEERAFVRSKFDPLNPTAIEKEPVDPLRVDGQVFIITNGEPMYFWDFTHMFMLGFGAPVEHMDNPKFTFGKTVGWYLSWAAEVYCWLTNKPPTFTRTKVQYLCGTRYYNIEKARRVLGYEPDVGLKEGIEKTLEWWRSQQQEAAKSKQ
ncbi:hypothetical protein M422DRAFT_73219 [Sphaerobolus stellatus SS14]|nr:hypothetical protein M422DRAFT_73219 [Sphaerobolus stellatus SS14]